MKSNCLSISSALRIAAISAGVVLLLSSAEASDSLSVQHATSAKSSEAKALTEKARNLLLQVFETERGWKKIHAAEALISVGDGDLVSRIFAENAAADEKSDYRIGAWRVRARTAKTPEERGRWTAKIEAVFRDVTSPDRLDAIETLAKLGVVVAGETRQSVVQFAAAATESDAIFPLWALAVAGEPGALERITVTLTSSVSEARGRAGYALRWLKPTLPLVLEAIARAADREASGSAAAYLTSAAFATNAKPEQAAEWQRQLENILASGDVASRFEACQGLMARATATEVPQLLPLLDDAESDTKIGAASAILHILQSGKKAGH